MESDPDSTHTTRTYRRLSHNPFHHHHHHRPEEFEVDGEERSSTGILRGFVHTVEDKFHHAFRHEGGRRDGWEPYDGTGVGQDPDPGDFPAQQPVSAVPISSTDQQKANLEWMRQHSAPVQESDTSPAPPSFQQPDFPAPPMLPPSRDSQGNRFSHRRSIADNRDDREQNDSTNPSRQISTRRSQTPEDPEDGSEPPSSPEREDQEPLATPREVRRPRNRAEPDHVFESRSTPSSFQQSSPARPSDQRTYRSTIPEEADESPAPSTDSEETDHSTHSQSQPHPLRPAISGARDPPPSHWEYYPPPPARERPRSFQAQSAPRTVDGNPPPRQLEQEESPPRPETQRPIDLDTRRLPPTQSLNTPRNGLDENASSFSDDEIEETRELPEERSQASEYGGRRRSVTRDERGDEGRGGGGPPETRQEQQTFNLPRPTPQRDPETRRYRERPSTIQVSHEDDDTDHSEASTMPEETEEESRSIRGDPRDRPRSATVRRKRAQSLTEPEEESNYEQTPPPSGEDPSTSEDERPEEISSRGTDGPIRRPPNSSRRYRSNTPEPVEQSRSRPPPAFIPPVDPPSPTVTTSFRDSILAPEEHDDLESHDAPLSRRAYPTDSIPREPRLTEKLRGSQPSFPHQRIPSTDSHLDSREAQRREEPEYSNSDSDASTDPPSSSEFDNRPSRSRQSQITPSVPTTRTYNTEENDPEERSRYISDASVPGGGGGEERKPYGVYSDEQDHEPASRGRLSRSRDDDIDEAESYPPNDFDTVRGRGRRDEPDPDDFTQEEETQTTPYAAQRRREREDNQPRQGETERDREQETGTDSEEDEGFSEPREPFATVQSQSQEAYRPRIPSDRRDDAQREDSSYSNRQNSERSPVPPSPSETGSDYSTDDNSKQIPKQTYTDRYESSRAPVGDFGDSTSRPFEPEQPTSYRDRKREDHDETDDVYAQSTDSEPQEPVRWPSERDNENSSSYRSFSESRNDVKPERQSASFALDSDFPEKEVHDHYQNTDEDEGYDSDRDPTDEDENTQASGLYRPASRSRVKTATPPQGRYNPEAEETSSEVGTEDSNEGYQTETDSDDDRRFDNQDKRRDREREFSEGEEEVEPSTDEDTKNRDRSIVAAAAPYAASNRYSPDDNEREDFDENNRTKDPYDSSSFSRPPSPESGRDERPDTPSTNAHTDSEDEIFDSTKESLPGRSRGPIEEDERDDHSGNETDPLDQQHGSPAVDPGSLSDEENFPQGSDSLSNEDSKYPSTEAQPQGQDYANESDSLRGDRDPEDSDVDDFSPKEGEEEQSSTNRFDGDDEKDFDQLSQNEQNPAYGNDNDPSSLSDTEQDAYQSKGLDPDLDAGNDDFGGRDEYNDSGAGSYGGDNFDQGDQGRNLGGIGDDYGGGNGGSYPADDFSSYGDGNRGSRDLGDMGMGGNDYSGFESRGEEPTTMDNYDSFGGNDPYDQGGAYDGREGYGNGGLGEDYGSLEGNYGENERYPDERESYEPSERYETYPEDIYGGEEEEEEEEEPPIVRHGIHPSILRLRDQKHLREAEYDEASRRYHDSLEHLHVLHSMSHVSDTRQERAVHEIFEAVHALRRIEEHQSRPLTPLPSADDLKISSEDYHRYLSSFQELTATDLEEAHAALRLHNSEENRLALELAQAKHDSALQHGHDHHSDQPNSHAYLLDDPEASEEEIHEAAVKQHLSAVHEPQRADREVERAKTHLADCEREGDPTQIRQARDRLRSALERQRIARAHLEEAETRLRDISSPEAELSHSHSISEPYTRALEEHLHAVHQRHSSQVAVAERRILLAQAEKSGNSFDIRDARRRLEDAEAELGRAEERERETERHLSHQERVESAQYSAELAADELERHRQHLEETSRRYLLGKATDSDLAIARTALDEAIARHSNEVAEHERAQDRRILEDPDSKQPPQALEEAAERLASHHKAQIDSLRSLLKKNPTEEAHRKLEEHIEQHHLAVSLLLHSRRSELDKARRRLAEYPLDDKLREAFEQAAQSHDEAIEKERIARKDLDREQQLAVAKLLQHHTKLNLETSRELLDRSKKDSSTSDEDLKAAHKALEDSRSRHEETLRESQLLKDKIAFHHPDPSKSEEANRLEHHIAASRLESHLHRLFLASRQYLEAAQTSKLEKKHSEFAQYLDRLDSTADHNQGLAVSQAKLEDSQSSVKAAQNSLRRALDEHNVFLEERTATSLREERNKLEAAQEIHSSSRQEYRERKVEHSRHLLSTAEVSPGSDSDSKELLAIRHHRALSDLLHHHRSRHKHSDQTRKNHAADVAKHRSRLSSLDPSDPRYESTQDKLRAAEEKHEKAEREHRHHSERVEEVRDEKKRFKEKYRGLFDRKKREKLDQREEKARARERRVAEEKERVGNLRKERDALRHSREVEVLESRLQDEEVTRRREETARLKKLENLKTEEEVEVHRGNVRKEREARESKARDQLSRLKEEKRQEQSRERERLGRARRERKDQKRLEKARKRASAERKKAERDEAHRIERERKTREKEARKREKERRKMVLSRATHSHPRRSSRRRS